MIPDKNSGSTKDSVINTLANKWPLSIRKIYSLVRKTNRVSYHAVYKIVKQLVNDSVLEEKNKEYFLGRDWIDYVSGFAEKLLSNYATRSSEQPNTFIFDNVAEADNYLMSMPSIENEIRVVQCRHLWWALFRPETYYFRMEKDKVYKNQTYVLCNSNTMVDKWCSSFESKMKKHIKLGFNSNNNCDVFVRGDRVIEIYYPKPLTDFLDKKYQNAKSIEKLDLNDLIKNFYRKKANIHVIVNKNKKIADHIRNVTLEQFS